MYVLCLIVLSLSIYAQNDKTNNPLTKAHQTRNPKAHSQDQESSSDNDRLCTNCEINGQPRKTQKEKSDEAFDRGFQRVYWVATIIGVFGGWVLLYFVRKQGQAIVNAERAWVMVDVLKSDGYPFSQYEDGVTSAYVTLKCRNDGATPCWIEDVAAGIAIVEKSAELPKPNIAKTEYRGPMPIGVAKESYPIRFTLQINDAAGPNQRLIVYGVVRYRHPFSHKLVLRKKLATTTFAYWYDGDSLPRLYSHPKYNKHT